MTENLMKLSLLLMSVLILVACGSAEDATPTEDSDIEPPFVKEVIPSSVSVNQKVDLNQSPIVFRLSEGIKESSLTALNAREITDSNNEPLDATWSFSFSNNNLTLTFNTLPLPASETFTIDLGDLTDNAGNHLAYTASLDTPSAYGIIVIANGLEGSETITVEMQSTRNTNTKGSTVASADSPSGFINGNLVDGESFMLSMTNFPESKFCSLSSTFGTINERNVSVEATCHNVLPYFADAPKWNDYYNNGNGKPSFVHGGEQRALTIIGYNSCDNIETTDKLGVFNWACEEISDADATKIRVFSTSLKTGKGLSDLLTFETTPDWKKNSLSVKQSGQIIQTTTDAIWWNNPVLLTPAAPELTVESAIYVHKDTSSSGADPKQAFEIRNRGIALVIDPATVLVTKLKGILVDNSVGSKNRTNFWIEGKFDSQSRNAGIVLKSTGFGRLNNLAISNSKDYGISISKSPLVTLTNVNSIGNTSSGLIVDESSHLELGVGIELINSTFSQNGESGIVLNSQYSKLINVHAMNNQNNGIVIKKGNNSLSGIFTSNNLNNGLVISSSQNNLLSMITSSNNNGHGVNFIKDSINSARYNNVYAVSAVNNKLSAIHYDDAIAQSDIDSNKVSNILDAYNAATNCFNCENISSISTDTTPPDDIFVSVASDSTVANYDAANGVGKGNIKNYLHLENLYRNWASGDLPTDTAGAGSCLADDQIFCLIRDSSLLSSDTLARNVVNVPTGEINFNYLGESSITYLENSLEINTDSIGNNNGFCEANETCIRIHNTGSYQGHGALVDYSGTNDIWSALGITLKQYEFNGY